MQPPHIGAHAAHLTQRLLVAAGVDQTRDLAPGADRQAHEGLAQHQAVLPGEAVQPLHRAQQQAAVGWVRHSLGLGGGIDGDAFERATAHRLGPQSGCQRFGQQHLELVLADPGPPARH